MTNRKKLQGQARRQRKMKEVALNQRPSPEVHDLRRLQEEEQWEREYAAEQAFLQAQIDLLPEPSPDRENEPFRLMDLPGELRNIVYAFMLRCDEYTVDLSGQPDSRFSFRGHLEVLQRLFKLSSVTEQIRTEVTEIFYSESTFDIYIRPEGIMTELNTEYDTTRVRKFRFIQRWEDDRCYRYGDLLDLLGVFSVTLTILVDRPYYKLSWSSMWEHKWFLLDKASVKELKQDFEARVRAILAQRGQAHGLTKVNFEFLAEVLSRRIGSGGLSNADAFRPMS